MTGIQPRGERVRKAVRFVSDALREERGRPTGPLIDAATLRFDLDPKQARYLWELFQKSRPTGRTDPPAG